jgi:sterol desaturase/sphingolipid hydroxylase (fatty acid hydroxylase superfamily)
MLLPVLLLVFSAHVVVWSMAFHSFLGSIAHSNIDVRLGVVGSVINGPEQHRLHHSMDLDEGNSNLGSAFVIFNRLFGTWLDPHARARWRRWRGRAAPKGFLSQLAAPFTSTVSEVDMNS